MGKSSLPGGLKGGSECDMHKVAFVACLFCVGQAMDLFVHAEAFRLGVKRSSIKLPWEKEPLSGFSTRGHD